MRTEWMKRTGAFLLWALVLLLLLAGLDQLLVRVPFTSPAPLAVTTFYRDVRSRLVELVKGQSSAPAPAKPAKPVSPAPVKGAPPATTPPPPPTAAAKPKPAPQAKEAAPRYVFADDQGELHFAETLAEVPEQYRARAQVLGE